jgi:hypothetical protein
MPLKVYAVWEPMLATDWMRPARTVLGRLADGRAVQYWDPDHLLAKKLSADARDPQPKEECCRRDGTLWDLAAVYPAGAMWNDTLPPAVFFNGSVVDTREPLAAAVAGSVRKN